MEKIISSRRVRLTIDIMNKCILMKSKSKSLKWYTANKKIFVNNRMQKGYMYILTFDAGTSLKHGGWDENGNPIKYPEFTPKYSPQQMLRMGVFEGKYCNDQIFEFPREWYINSKGKLLNTFSPEHPDDSCNYFKIKSRQSLQTWKKNKWIPCASNDKDTRGWFEWYMRYWLGRRQPNIDKIQIGRWKRFRRHYAQVVKHAKGDISKRQKQRQALLQWSWSALD